MIKRRLIRHTCLSDERGYALVFDQSGALVKDASQLAPGTEISARVARGGFTAEVTSTKTD